MAQARPLSNVGSRTSFFAAFQSLAAAHTSNRLNHALASPSSKGSGKHIVFPVAIVPGFGTTVTTRKNNPENSHNSVIINQRCEHMDKGDHVSAHKIHYTHTQSIIYPITHKNCDKSLAANCCIRNCLQYSISHLTTVKMLNTIVGFQEKSYVILYVSQKIKRNFLYL